MKILTINTCNECPYFESFVDKINKRLYLYVCLHKRFLSNAKIIAYSIDTSKDMIDIPDTCELEKHYTPPPHSARAYLPNLPDPYRQQAVDLIREIAEHQEEFDLDDPLYNRAVKFLNSLIKDQDK
jgi:hypothetical protein